MPGAPRRPTARISHHVPGGPLEMDEDEIQIVALIFEMRDQGAVPVDRRRAGGRGPSHELHRTCQARRTAGCGVYRH